MTSMEEDGPDMAFDLESYISNYSGNTKVQRLLFIADRMNGKPLEKEALKLAADELRRGLDTNMYSEVTARLNALGAGYERDQSWIDSVERSSAVKLEQLEAQLHSFKTNLIKESIRMGHNDLGDFYYDRGDMQNAFKAFVRSRDYCTTGKHIISMCLSVIRIGVAMRSFLHITNFVGKAEATPELAGDTAAAAKLKAATGLAFLDTKKYKMAARRFAEVSPELGNTYNDVIAAQDIATYGGLCALASMDRSELKERIITNLAFKEYLAAQPQVRELILDFYHSRYSSCLRLLERLRPTLMLDLHVASHVDGLYHMIRQKALVQYTSPFTSVHLGTMAAAFSAAVPAIEKELAALIVDNQIQARIDSHNKVLYAKHADARNATFSRVLATGEEYLRETKALLLRASVLQHDLVQRPPRGARQERPEREGRAGVMERLGPIMMG